MTVPRPGKSGHLATPADHKDVCSVTLREAGHRHIPGLRKGAPMQLDPLDLMQGFGGQIALSAMETDHYRTFSMIRSVAPFP